MSKNWEIEAKIRILEEGAIKMYQNWRAYVHRKYRLWVSVTSIRLFFNLREGKFWYLHLSPSISPRFSPLRMLQIWPSNSKKSEWKACSRTGNVEREKWLVRFQIQGDFCTRFVQKLADFGKKFRKKKRRFLGRIKDLLINRFKGPRLKTCY